MLYTPEPQVEIIGNDAILVQKLEGNTIFAIALRINHAQSELCCAGNRIVGTCHARFREKMDIFVTLVSNIDTPDYKQEAIRRLDAAEAAGFEQIKTKHCQWWHDYYAKAYILIDHANAEKSYYTSLYIIGSILSPHHQSPGLQGCWHKEHVPAWLGDYHTNVNLQALYWGLFANNRLALTRPLLNIVKRIAVQAKKDTRNYFHMRGLRLPHAGSADGYELTQGDWAISLGCSVGGSGWIADLLWQIYDYSGDKKLLQEEIYPLLKPIALFYEDYLQRDKNGRLELAPSLFFEAQCPRFEAWGRNSLHELVMLRMGLRAAINAAEALSVDQEQCAIWSRILFELPPYPSDGDNEWIAYPDNDLRRFGSHQYALPPVFPGNFVSKWHGPEVLQKQAFATLNSRYTSSSLTGKAWCGGQGLREIIRMGKSAEALEGFETGNTNALTYRWDAGYMQVDHAPGMCSVLPDMMLLKTGDIIRLFADFPRQINAAFSRLLAPGAFEISSELRDGEIAYVRVTSLCGNLLQIANPWENGEWEIIANGESILKGTDSEIKVATSPAQMYIIQRAAYPYYKIAEKIY